MSIVQISGPSKSGKSVVANALRNYYVNQGRGVLLVDSNNAAAGSADLLAKIVDAAMPDKPLPAAAVKWKKDPVIVLVGDQAARLADFEKLAPGFAELHGGAAFTISTAAVAVPAARAAR